MKILMVSAAVAALALAGCSHDKKEMMAEEAPSTAAAPNEPASGDAAVDVPTTSVETSTGGGDAGVSTAAAPNEPVSGDPNTNPAADACYENGGSIVTWYDADGEGIDACRTSDGAEISLDDYLTYGAPAEPAEG